MKLNRTFCETVGFAAFAAIVSFLWLTGCSSTNHLNRERESRFQNGESLILVGEQPAQLAFAPVRGKTVSLRNTYRRNLTNTISYQEETDFVVNYETGQISRTAQSRIPDFRTNMLFGVEDFDHSKFPGYGNLPFVVYADYGYKKKVLWPEQKKQTEFLSATRQKLVAGEKVKIVAFGDSITAGGEASEPTLIFWQRWADWLQEKYPHAQIQAVNGATGGDSTPQGLHRLQEKVLNQKPDLVLIGFGMNDNNIGGFGTPLVQFENNLRVIVDRIRKETAAEIILFSAFPPNPKWHYGSKNMEAYAAATQKVAEEKNCAFADVYRNWIFISEKKKPEDLLGNNINHPNDFGHAIYFETLQRLGL